MKRLISPMIIAAITLLGFASAIPAVGQQTNRAVVIKRDTKLGSEALPKGEYEVKFVEDKDGELVFLRGKREVLRATYKVTQLERAANDNAVVSVMASDGTVLLKRIEFKGQKTALLFEDTVAKSIQR
jgi:hypothetical protein